MANTSNTNIKIELRGVEKRFGKKEILTGANLKIMRGSTQVILGKSGTGKSVLLKCVLGMEPIQAGEIFVDGAPVSKLHGAERMELMAKFGMLFQGAALFDSMNIWENVAFVLLQQGMRRAQAKEIALEKLRMVGLKPEVAEQNPADLSGGMRKRAGLARAICHNPEIIFYDEPTTGLDPITADVINDLIIKLQAELKCTSVVITHDMASAFKVADRMAFLYDGQFVAEGTADEFKTTKDPMVKQFVEGRADGPIQVTY
jgi:phospholipid/cholesterol/gamma-HCH transport system ATP-binding protein